METDTNQQDLHFYGYDRKNTDNLVLDHINSIKTDNRLSNLEIVTKSENKLRFWKSPNAELTRKKLAEKRNKKQNQD